MDRPDAPPQLWIEQLHLGELSPEREATLRSQYGDDAIEAALAQLRQSDETLGARYPTATMARAIEARVAQAQAEARRRRTRGLLALGPALAVAAVVLVMRPGADDVTPDAGGGAGTGEGVEVTRLKGDVEVRVYRRRQNPDDPSNPFIESLPEGAKVRAGDVLQLGYSSNKPYAALLSVDGRGAVTLHFPNGPEQPPRLPKAAGLLPFAYELDDSPDFERFYLFASDSSFAVSDVQAALQTVTKRMKPGVAPAPPELADFETVTLTLRKEKP